MRIPVNSCAGCNRSPAILPSGYHVDEAGVHTRCRFLAAEQEDLRGWEIVRVYRDRAAALREAYKLGGALYWVGQSPWPMWAVVKEG